MKPEEKQILFQDLCARLPYGLKVNYKTAGWEDKNHTLSPQTIDNFLFRRDVVIKPYLRPMSSMTEEEEKQFQDVNLYELPYRVEGLDWLNAHHFDYRGLIQKGLALSTEEFNPYKD